MKLEHPDRLMNRTPCHSPRSNATTHSPSGTSAPIRPTSTRCSTRSASRRARRCIDAVIPESIRRTETLPLGAFAQPKSEAEALASLREARGQEPGVPNSYIGQGYYGTHTPAVILRNVLENPAWYTAYTPYQPEISQGRLEALLNFQQMIDRPDGSRDLERVAARRSHRRRRSDDAAATRRQAEVERVLRRRRRAAANHRSGADAREAGRHRSESRSGRGCRERERVRRAAAISGRERRRARLPRADRSDPRGGRPRGRRRRSARADRSSRRRANGARTSPIGNTQRFGVPVGFGGPHAAYMAVRDEFKRQMPGRLVGVTVDAQGNSALRLALQTREQHIRREKATSNVCTAQALLAIMASMYAVYHGPHGLKTIALRVNRVASMLRGGREEARLHARQRNVLRHAHDRQRREHDSAASGGVRARISICAT